MKAFYLSLLIFCNIATLDAYMLHLQSPKNEGWKKESLSPFDQLMLTWNGERPKNGKFFFHIRVKIDDWSPWLLYASWGSDGQSSYKIPLKESHVQTFEDAIEILDGKKATAFEVKITKEGEALLDQIRSLHIYINSDKTTKISPSIPTQSVELKVAGLSQMKLNHPLNKNLCSPTSTSCVTRFLLSCANIDPLDLAKNVFDSGSNIYGNWVFNVAAASTYLGPKWDCWVERLNSFDDIYNRLMHKTPVIISLRGPIKGSALAYEKGHLMAVIGFDAASQKVLCMDPAFPEDNKTIVAYDLSDFEQAWSRRGNVAYIFEEKNTFECSTKH